MSDSREILDYLESDLRELGVAASEEPLRPDTGLFGQGIGLDSLEILQLVTRMEERLGITIEDAELDAANFETAGDFVRLVRAKRS